MRYYALTGATALACSALLTFAMRKIAVSRGLLDVPNERSSHDVSTPRGGGAAIVIAATAAFIVLGATYSIDRALILSLVGGGLAVAAVGFIDDHRSLPASLRLAVHIAAAIWAVAWLGGLPAVNFGGRVVAFGPAGNAVAVLGIVWTLNLFNFMDGIDGIAASEAVFIAWSGAALAFVAGAVIPVGATALSFGAACCGFLLWNWPPAKIFMGDVGSGYIGYVIAVLAVAAARENTVALPVWLILGGIFFVDATITVIRRLVRGEQIYEAHRSHGYQWLARRWQGHRSVTISVMALNICWLLPCALLATLYPNRAGWLVVVALVPVVLLSIAAGSGRAERKQQ